MHCSRYLSRSWFWSLVCLGSLAGCAANPEPPQPQPENSVSNQPVELKVRSARASDARVVAGDGWTIAVPGGWIEEATEPPFEAQLVSAGPGTGKFTVHTVELKSGVADFIQASIRGVTSHGAREAARRALEIDSVAGTVVEFVTVPQESTLLGIGRVIAVSGQVLAVVCSSASERYLRAKETCDEILGSIRAGESAMAVKPGVRRIADERQTWSLQVPVGWRDQEHASPMVALVVSNDPPNESISVSVLAARVDGSPGKELELAHSYLSDEAAQGSFRLLDRRDVPIGGRKGLEFDFFKERSSPSVRVEQVYLAKGDLGLVLSCGTSEDAAKSVRDDCNAMFTSLRFDGPEGRR